MPADKMHEDEVATDAGQVRRLIAAQFPQWADLTVEPVASAGTDNALYRLGDEMAVRLPRIHWATAQVDKEAEWLPKLAPHLPLSIPEPSARGEPGEGYPWRWSVCRWLAGENATLDRIGDPLRAAADLASFVRALQAINPAGGPTPDPAKLGRGAPLATRDVRTRAALADLASLMDTHAAETAWDVALRAPEWSGQPVWIHGDLHSGNLLARDGRITSVIDFGALGIGDPACDLMPAWNLFAEDGRDAFRSAVAGGRRPPGRADADGRCPSR